MMTPRASEGGFPAPFAFIHIHVYFKSVSSSRSDDLPTRSLTFSFPHALWLTDSLSLARSPQGVRRGLQGRGPCRSGRGLPGPRRAPAQPAPAPAPAAPRRQRGRRKGRERGRGHDGRLRDRRGGMCRRLRAPAGRHPLPHGARPLPQELPGRRARRLPPEIRRLTVAHRE